MKCIACDKTEALYCGPCYHEAEEWRDKFIARQADRLEELYSQIEQYRAGLLDELPAR